MQKWEYCEIWQLEGRTFIRYCKTTDYGYDVEEVKDRDTANMAKVLARLGLEGWEVIAAAVGTKGSPANHRVFSYLRPSETEHGTSVMLLKRPLPEAK